MPDKIISILMDASVVSGLLSRGDTPAVVLQNARALVIGNAIGTQEVKRITNIKVLSDIFRLIFPKLTDEEKIAFLRQFKHDILESPYNGKLLCTQPKLNIFGGLLGILTQTTSRPLFERVLNIIYILMIHHMSPAQIISYFRVLATFAAVEDSININSRYFKMVQYLQKALEVQHNSENGNCSANQVSPRSFFDFNGLNQKSGIRIPQFNLKSHAYTFSCWFRAETFIDFANRSGFQPTIFSFSTQQGGCLQAYFKVLTRSGRSQGSIQEDKAVLILEITQNKKSQPQRQQLEFIFTAKTWYNIAITHEYARLFSSAVNLFVNGGLVCTSYTKYPGFGSTPLEYCFIGTNMHTKDSRSTSFYGQMGNIYFLKELLKPDELKTLSQQPPSIARLPKTFTKQFLFAYSPEASYYVSAYHCFRVCNFAVESIEKPQHGVLLFNGTLFEGSVPFVCKTIRESFYNAGGFDLLFSLFEMPVVHSNMIDTLSDNIQLQEQLGLLTGGLLRLLGTVLQGNPPLHREMNHRKAISLLHAFMKRYAPYNLCPEVIEGIKYLTCALNHSKLLVSICKDFLFDFSLWCTGTYEFTIQFVIRIQQDLSPEIIRSVGVSYLLEIIKAYYWLTNDKTQTELMELAPKLQILLPPNGSLPYKRFSPGEILYIRSIILKMVKSIMVTKLQADDTAAVLSFLLHPPDGYQRDIVHLLLQLLVFSEHRTTLVSHIESEGFVYAFFYLLENKQETVRTLAIRVIGFLLENGSRKMWKEFGEEQSPFHYICEQLQLISPSAYSSKTFIALFEVATGMITDEIRKSGDSSSHEFYKAKEFRQKLFLPVVLELLLSAVSDVSIDVIKGIMLPVLATEPGMKAFTSLPSFPCWLQKILSKSLREEIRPLQQLSLKMYDRLFQFCLLRKAGWKFIEKSASFGFVSNGRQDFNHFFYHQLLYSCHKIVLELPRIAAEKHSTIHNNLGFLFVLFEEFLFFPAGSGDTFQAVMIIPSLTLRRHDGDWEDYEFAKKLLEVVDAFVRSLYIDQVRGDIQTQLGRDIFPTLVHLQVQTLREFAIESFSSPPLSPLSSVNTPKFSIGDDNDEEDPSPVSSFKILGDAQKDKKRKEFETIDLQMDRLRELTFMVTKSSDTNNELLLWIFNSIIDLINKLKRKTTIQRSVIRLYQEYMKCYRENMETLLGCSFTDENAHGLNDSCNSETFLIYFHSQQENFHLMFCLGNICKQIEEKYGESALWFKEREEHRQENVSRNIKQTAYSHGKNEDELLSNVNAYKNLSLKVDTSRASWLWHEAERNQLAVTKMTREERILLHHEHFSFFKSSGDRKYWKLDPTEDSLRRRLKMRRNYNGSCYKEFSLDFIREKEQDLIDNNTGAPLRINEDVYHTLTSSGMLTYENEKEEDDNPDNIELINDATENHTDAEDWCVVDSKNFKDEETLLSISCELISSQNVFPGSLDITKHQLYFSSDPITLDNNTKPKKLKNKHWLLRSVTGIHRRRYLLRNTALEIFLDSHRGFLFNFKSNEREKVHSLLISAATNLKNFSKYQSPQKVLRHSDLTQRWQQGVISNFEYIMELNTLAGRTYNDLSQYPIAPWILTDYHSKNLNLQDPSIYRDLSKPIGALNPKRFEEFRSRYEILPDDDPTMPKFMYGSHYSTALVVLYYLIRMEPFTKQYLELQGRFDHADRMFDSISTAWYNSFTLSQDVKELIPEFFYNPTFLRNENNLDLGTRQQSELPIDHVELPPWAATPEEFVRIHRDALESEFVSAHLHEWIDLIFGYKQRGKYSHEANNVFYHLTYEGAVNIDAINDPVLRNATIEQIISFGQTPTQLFVKPHPKRQLSSIHRSLGSLFSGQKFTVLDTIEEIKFIPIQFSVSERKLMLLSPIGQCISISYTYGNGKTFKSSIDPHYTSVGAICAINSKLGPLGCSSFLVDFVNKMLYSFGHWDCSVRCTQLRSPFGVLQSFVAHKGIVTCCALTESLRFLVSGSEDCTVMVWDLNSPAIVRTKQIQKKSPMKILRGHTSPVRCLAVLEDLDLVVSASSNCILIHTLFSGDYVRRIVDNASKPFIVGVSLLKIVAATGKIIAYSALQNSLMMFDINGRFNGIKNVICVKDILVSQDGKNLVTIGEQVCFWRLHDLYCTQRVDLKSPSFCAKFSVDESLLFVVIQSLSDTQSSELIISPVTFH